MIGFDPLYLMFALPGLLLALYASWRTRSTFSTYSEYAPASGLTGAEAAATTGAGEPLTRAAARTRCRWRACPAS